MFRPCLLLLALVSLPALGQGYVTVHSHCPVEAARITPRVYGFRIYTAGQEGWRPASKVTLDLAVKNASTRGIAAMSFEIGFPHGYALSRSWNDVQVKLDAGGERTLYFNQLLDLPGATPNMSVVLTMIRYADGEIYDANCELGTAVIPPPFVPIRPSAPSQIYKVGGEVSPPRVLESHPLDTAGVAPNSHSSVVLSTMIDVDGTPQDIHVSNGTLGSPALDSNAIETLKKWNFAPAMLGEKPVAVVINIDFQT